MNHQYHNMQHINGFTPMTNPTTFSQHPAKLCTKEDCFIEENFQKIGSLFSQIEEKMQQLDPSIYIKY